MLWKNGLGQSAEVERFPAEGDSYSWRLSLASVNADGPFSIYAGFDRWLTLIRGGSVFLNQMRLEPLKPFRFRGEEAIHCRLEDDPVLDVGFIFDRSRIDAKMEIVSGHLHLLEPSGLSYVVELDTRDTLRIEGAERLFVPRSVLITVHRKGE